MGVENCPDCDYASTGGFSSDGKCSRCHGTGKAGGFIETVNVAFGMQSKEDDCPACHGTKKCRTCDGKGYIST